MDLETLTALVDPIKNQPIDQILSYLMDIK